MTGRSPRRRGYAMVGVVLFVVLFLALWGQAARQVGSMLRIEQARARRVTRDTTALPSREALSQGLGALQIGYPPTAPYTCRSAIPSGASYALTFALDPITSGGWILTAEPTSDTSLPPLDLSLFQPNPNPPAP